MDIVISNMKIASWMDPERDDKDRFYSCRGGGYEDLDLWGWPLVSCGPTVANATLLKGVRFYYFLTVLNKWVCQEQLRIFVNVFNTHVKNGKPLATCYLLRTSILCCKYTDEFTKFLLEGNIWQSFIVQNLKQTGIFREK